MDRIGGNAEIVKQDHATAVEKKATFGRNVL